MDIDIKDISNDDLLDLNLHDDLFKLHMTFKTLSQSVDNLENYMYTGIIDRPDKAILNDLTQEVTVWCNCIKSITNGVNKNGAVLINRLNEPDDRGD